MTTHPSSNTHTSSATTATTGAQNNAQVHAGQTASSQATTGAGAGVFSTQVEPEPQILSHEQGTGWERTVTQVPGEEPVHSIKLAGHIKGIPGRR
ncbi:hypothetical protein EC991_006297 [Linnemannia zychae]|nr:hypothetical protein EC991_006297 [Linnemannia zychae]